MLHSLVLSDVHLIVFSFIWRRILSCMCVCVFMSLCVVLFLCVLCRHRSACLCKVSCCVFVCFVWVKHTPTARESDGRRRRHSNVWVSLLVLRYFVCCCCCLFLWQLSYFWHLAFPFSVLFGPRALSIVIYWLFSYFLNTNFFSYFLIEEI